MMNVVFFGTPSFVIPIADSLSDSPFSIAAIVTTPDRPVGRRQILTPSPIKQWALAHQINVINDATVLRSAVALKKLKPDLGILAAYGKIIPSEVIDLFPKGILVIHPSLLPKYRGASPVPTAILNGEKETGVSIIRMDEKMDHGPIVYQFKEPIKEDDTSETLLIRLFDETAKRLPKVLNDYLEEKITPIEQNHNQATFCKILKKEDGFIKPEVLSTALKIYDPSSMIYHHIRAMTPWPGAWTEIILPISNTTNTTNKQSFSANNSIKKRLKILKAHIEPVSSIIHYPSSELILDEVQLEGKTPVSWSQFQKSYPGAKF